MFLVQTKVSTALDIPGKEGDLQEVAIGKGALLGGLPGNTSDIMIMMP